MSTLNDSEYNDYTIPILDSVLSYIDPPFLIAVKYRLDKQLWDILYELEKLALATNDEAAIALVASIFFS